MQPRFPLEVSPDRRHLVDADGAPFLYHADTGWYLIVSRTLAEAEAYLDDRRRRGFTAVHAHLLAADTYAPNAPNRNGERPFRDDGLLTQPNEPYFAHAERVLRAAAERGLLVALSPAWFG